MEQLASFVAAAAAAAAAQAVAVARGCSPANVDSRRWEKIKQFDQLLERFIIFFWFCSLKEKQNFSVRKHFFGHGIKNKTLLSLASSLLEHEGYQLIALIVEIRSVN